MHKNIVCTYKGTYGAYKSYWDNQDIEFDYLTDVTKTDLPVGIQYTEQDIRNSFNFTDTVSPKHYYNSHGNRNVIWFYAHFRMLYYYLQNKGYDYYWFFDDDVTVADWDLFYKSFENNTSDFISLYCFKNIQVNTQPLIPKMNENSYSGNQWFMRFPGYNDRLPRECTDLFGSFFPIVRLSKRSLTLLIRLLKDKMYGYSEGFVPTILNHHGYTLDTIFDENSNAKYFDDTKVDVKHKHTKIKWSWI